MTRDMLLASLTTISEHESYYPGDDDDRRYFDWSSRYDDKVHFEMGNEDGEAINLLLTDDELRELHTRLTVYLRSKTA